MNKLAFSVLSFVMISGAAYAQNGPLPSDGTTMTLQPTVTHRNFSISVAPQTAATVANSISHGCWVVVAGGNATLRNDGTAAGASDSTLQPAGLFKCPAFPSSQAVSVYNPSTTATVTVSGDVY